MNYLLVVYYTFTRFQGGGLSVVTFPNPISLETCTELGNKLVTAYLEGRLADFGGVNAWFDCIPL